MSAATNCLPCVHFFLTSVLAIGHTGYGEEKAKHAWSDCMAKQTLNGGDSRPVR